MSERRSMLDEMLAALKRQRDELALQMHLGKSEAKEQWERLQAKYDELSSEYAPVREAVGETADNVLTGLELTAGEIKRGFERVSQLLSEKFEDGEDKAGK